MVDIYSMAQTVISFLYTYPTDGQCTNCITQNQNLLTVQSSYSDMHIQLCQNIMPVNLSKTSKLSFRTCENKFHPLDYCTSSLYNDMATATSNPPKLDRASLQKIAELFRVFSEPTRLGILQFLKGRSTSVNEIVEALETSQANISKQLRILYDADLLIREQKGNQVFYSIKESMVFDLCGIVCDKLNRSAQAGADNFYEI